MVEPPKTNDIDPWHYARAELTKSVYDTLANKAAVAVRLFQARRTGKSQFLMHDLGPYAMAQGHPVAFANLQENPSPIAAILSDIQEAKVQPEPQARKASWFKKGELKFDATGKVPGGLLEGQIGGKAEFERPDDLPPLVRTGSEMSELEKLEKVLSGFGTAEKPGFLLLDEFQVLGDHYNAKAILARLRKILDGCAPNLRIVFTGSSIGKLNAIFLEDISREPSDRPFANYAADLPWKPFDQEFVEHLRNVYKGIKQKDLDLTELSAFFESVEHNPEIMRWLFGSLMLDPDQPVTDAGKNVIDDMGRNHGWDVIWENASPIRRVVLRMIAEGQTDLNGAAGKARYLHLLGKEPGANTISNAIGDLNKTSSIPLERRKRGVVQITDHTFRIWLRWRDEQAFRIV